MFFFLMLLLTPGSGTSCHRLLLFFVFVLIVCFYCCTAATADSHIRSRNCGDGCIWLFFDCCSSSQPVLELKGAVTGRFATAVLSVVCQVWCDLIDSEGHL